MSRYDTPDKSMTTTGSAPVRSSWRSTDRRCGDESTVTRPVTVTVDSELARTTRMLISPESLNACSVIKRSM